MGAFGPFTVFLRAKEDAAHKTPVYFFDKPEGFDFCPGQYVTLRIPQPRYTDARGASRPLSIASAPEDAHIALSWRTSDSAFKRSVEALSIGDPVEILGPFGHFLLPDDQEIPIIFLIGGIGITPVRSMLRAERFRKSTRSCTLLYSNRTPEDAPFLQEFLQGDLLSAAHCHLTMTSAPQWQGPHGYITAETLESVCGTYKQAHFYIVGPSGFVKAMSDVLATHAIDAHQIHIDDFGAY